LVFACPITHHNAQPIHHIRNQIIQTIKGNKGNATKTMIFSKYAILTILGAAYLNQNADAFVPSSVRSISTARHSAQRFEPLMVSLSEVDSMDVAESDDNEEDIVEVEEELGEGEFGEDVAESLLTEEELDGVDAEDDSTIAPYEVVYDGKPPAWAESQQRIQDFRMKHRRHEKDTGSPEFQVAGMTERISYLTKHLQVHPKDFSTRRGLVALVNKRRRLLNYLSRESPERYLAVVHSLGIRHKPPSKVRSRQEQYGRFPRQKAIKKHLVQKKKK